MSHGPVARLCSSSRLPSFNISAILDSKRTATKNRPDLRHVSFETTRSKSVSSPDKTLGQTTLEDSDNSLKFLTSEPSLLSSDTAYHLSPSQPESDSLLSRLANDQMKFYSKDSVLKLGLVLGASSLIANTSADEQLQKHFQSSVRGATSDNWFEFLHASKELGNGVYTLPIMGAAWIAKEVIDGPPAFETFGTWGERSLRGFIVGAPPLVVLQRLTGGSRPYETADGSEWHPFRDNNGVSGHAFMSSLPFITAAKMTENPWGKTLWYVGSTIGPLSRVNDNAHYPSQIGAGWAMAFIAATAVHPSGNGKRGWQLLPESPSGGSGFAFRYQW